MGHGDEDDTGGRVRSDRDLADRARHHDVEAWDAVYRDVRRRLFASARRRLPTPEAADDAVSETMARALQGVEHFAWVGAGIERWLFGILRNVIMESYRRGAHEDLGHPDGLDRAGEDDQPLDRMLAQEDAARVRAAFACLRPADREVLHLRVVRALDAVAVGALLDKQPAAVRMAQSRALGRLRALILPEA